MRQPGLINRIIADLGLTDSLRTKSTPSDGTLGPCKDSDPFQGPWKYRSVLGKLFYLGNNTRCELAYANHRCARFANDPRVPHAEAVKRIGRYLLGTRDKGMYVRPDTSKLSLDVWCDSDFAGAFSYEDPNDATSARSRTGFVITLGGIPIVWTSKLQDLISQSTMESEYIALSTAMRSLLPLRTTLFDICSTLHVLQPLKSTIHTTVYEDNQAAYKFAKNSPPKLTPRTKHIAVKYHWFLSHLHDPNNDIELLPCKSEDNLGDIFTKALSELAFVRCRRRLLGW